jgi:hypothetical protein
LNYGKTVDKVIDLFTMLEDYTEIKSIQVEFKGGIKVNREIKSPLVFNLYLSEALEVLKNSFDDLCLHSNEYCPDETYTFNGKFLYLDYNCNPEINSSYQISSDFILKMEKYKWDIWKRTDFKEKINRELIKSYFKEKIIN